MRYLSKFNESSSEDINEYLNDIFISLIDIGYRVEIENTGSSDGSGIFSINIDKYKDSFNMSDICDEFLRCVYFLRDEGIIPYYIITTTEDRPYVEIYRDNEVEEIIYQLQTNMKWSSKFFKLKKVNLQFASKKLSIPKSFLLT